MPYVVTGLLVAAILWWHAQTSSGSSSAAQVDVQVQSALLAPGVMAAINVAKNTVFSVSAELYGGTIQSVTSTNQGVIVPAPSYSGQSVALPVVGGGSTQLTIQWADSGGVNQQTILPVVAS